MPLNIFALPVLRLGTDPLGFWQTSVWELTESTCTCFILIRLLYELGRGSKSHVKVTCSGRIYIGPTLYGNQDLHVPVLQRARDMQVFLYILHKADKVSGI